MIHPIPPGTRDVLPDEMRELRRLNRRLIEVFEDAGYGEVATPAIEYDEVLARGDRPSSASPYRFFDENGDLLALRSDMTVPIARLVATRFADAELPLRLCYLASAYRAVLPQRGEMREFVQAGIELIGAPGAAHRAPHQPRRVRQDEHQQEQQSENQQAEDQRVVGPERAEPVAHPIPPLAEESRRRGLAGPPVLPAGEDGIERGPKPLRLIDHRVQAVCRDCASTSRSNPSFRTRRS